MTDYNQFSQELENSKDLSGYSSGHLKKRAAREGSDWKWQFWPPSLFSWPPFIESKAPKPPADQESPPAFENELSRTVEQSIDDCLYTMTKHIASIQSEFEKVCSRLGVTGEDERENLQIQSSLKSEYKTVQKELSQLDPPMVNRYLMFAILVFIGISEFFLNATVFQFLGEGRWETYLMAAGIGFVIPVVAHILGEQFKQKDKTYKQWIGLIAVFIFCWAGIIWLAKLRSFFFEAKEMAEVMGIETDVKTMEQAFGAINTLLFFAAIYFSYQGSSPQQARYKKLQKRLRQLSQNMDEENNNQTGSTRGLVDRLHELLEDWERIINETESAVRGLENKYEELVWKYRNANYQARPDDREPEWMRQELIELEYENKFSDQKRKLEEAKEKGFKLTEEYARKVES